jgi:PPM family protein phosphatase
MIEHSGVSEQGPVRTNNEDYIAHCCPPDAEVRAAKGYLFVVADGVGGDNAGEVASKEAAEKLIEGYYASQKPWARALQEAFGQANMHVHDLSHTSPEYRRMQTTLSAIALLNNQAFIGHVGDTRIYRVRGHEITQLTRDHSEVAELVRMQIITADEARHHPRRNIITRALGGDPFMQPEYHSIEVEKGDIFLLCTDGLWEPLTEREIAGIISTHPAHDSCRKLIDLAIERGTNDNLSIQVAKVVEWERHSEQNTPPVGLGEKILRIFRKSQKGA